MNKTEQQQIIEMIRHDIGADGRRDLSSANISLRAETIDEATRSVDVVLATEQAVTVFDWNTFRTIDEVLRMDGMEIAPHVPLLDNHTRSNDDVFGSFGNFRREGTELIARMEFANLLAEPTLRNDPEALRVERAWVRVKQNHNRNVSVGYRVLESVDIPAGESREVNGQVYRAGDRSLRVAVRWIVREGSLTPVGADHSATTRSTFLEGNFQMNERLRQFLQSLGLRADATQAEAWEFFRQLQGDNRSQATGLINVQVDILPADVRALIEQPVQPVQPGTVQPGQAVGQPGQFQANPQQPVQQIPVQPVRQAIPPQQPAAYQPQGYWPQPQVQPEPVRSQQPVQQPQPAQNQLMVQPAAPAVPGLVQPRQLQQGELLQSVEPAGQALIPGQPFLRREGIGQPGQPGHVDVQGIVDQTLRANDERVRSLQNLFGQDEPELLQRAIVERWTPEQASQELLPRIRQRQSEAAGANLFQGGIHSRGSGDLNNDVLSMALLLREAPGLVESEHLLNSTRARLLGLPGVMIADINDDSKQRSLEVANRFSQHSLVDICELALRLNPQFGPGRIPHNRDEMIRSAFSSGSLNDLFTTNIHARVFVAFEDAPDSTDGWCSETDNLNFMQHEAVAQGKVGALTKHARGGQADHLDREANMEPHRIARYSGLSVIDEMDIIDNRFGGADDIASPEDMGNSARQLRPNLVYSIIHANDNLTHTGRALFNATDGNNISGAALSIPALEGAEIAFGERRDRDRPLNLTLDFLIVPRQLKWVAKQILMSGRRKGNTDEGDANPISDENVELRTDSRLGPGGCVDPDTETSHTGTSTNFVTATKPGNAGTRGMQVAYRSGANRAPQIRSSVLNQGRWGISFDVNMDIGAKALAHKGINFHTGV